MKASYLYKVAIALHRCIRYHYISVSITIFALIVLFLASQSPELIAFFPAVSASILLSFIGIFLVSSILLKLPKMIMEIRPKSPIRHLVSNFIDAIKDPGWLANFLFVAVFFSIFAATFSVNKALIGARIGFHWDDFLARLDQFLLFGKSAYQLFSWVPKNPVISLFYEFLYQTWFYVYYLSVAAVAASVVSADVGRRYLLASVICWFLGGNILAAAFNSAGPIFIEIHGDVSYQAHLIAMQAALPWVGSFALGVKDSLHSTYIAYGFSSISAFPSMHVASTLLIYFLVRESFGLRMRVAAALFLMAIFTGSVALLWHYLVDSIAGVVIAIIAWLVSGKILDRWGNCKDP